MRSILEDLENNSTQHDSLILHTYYNFFNSFMDIDRFKAVFHIDYFLFHNYGLLKFLIIQGAVEKINYVLPFIHPEKIKEILENP